MSARMILRLGIYFTICSFVVHGCSKKSVAIEASSYERVAETTVKPATNRQHDNTFETSTLIDLLLVAKAQNVTENTEDELRWNPKNETAGYVGLINQGATCYLNSALQMLFFVKSLTKSVFQIPLIQDDHEKKKSDLALAFQRIFYKLKFGDDAVSTKEFTRALGWGPLDHLEQQDAAEFLTRFIQKIETEMKNTKVEWDTSKLFDWKLESYIKCLNVNCTHSREETYGPLLHLNVKGNKNVYESFSDYTQPEQLVADNCYMDNEYGCQAAEKGYRFKSFPPVLFLQLMRIDYDWDKDSVVKLSSRLEYLVELNLTQFLHSDEQVNGNNTTYVLQSVLVYTGNGSAGHYIVYSNPKCDGQWFRFDDKFVRQATVVEATGDNYGNGYGTKTSIWDKSTLAYMLVYIQKGSMGDILKEITLDDIPSALQKQMEAEKMIFSI